MSRSHRFPNGYGAKKKDDDDGWAQIRNKADLEKDYIWGMSDLVEDDKNDSAFYPKLTPRRSSLHNRTRLYRLLAFLAVVLITCTFLLFPSARSFTSIGSQSVQHDEHFEIETLRYYDLDEAQGSSTGWKREERILLCTPLRDAEPHLHMMFEHLRNFTYPHRLIDLAFLVSDSKDRTKEVLSDLLERQQADPDPQQPFGEISVIHKDFGQKVDQNVETRHGFAAQASRRKLMAQARNWLLSACLRPYHSWVYWRDADVETCPYTVLEDLMRHDKDVIVPNVWRPLPDWLGGEQPYDLNSWQESETALALADQLDEDAVIVEGYAEYATWRPHLAYLRDPYGDPDVEMELDGVGGVSILAKARVFRAGVHFPAFSFERHAETEGFGKMARRMQFSVVGLPHYTVWHLYEPSIDDIRHMEEMEAERHAREDEEKTRKESEKKAKDDFQDVEHQWEKDRTAIKEALLKAHDQKAAVGALLPEEVEGLKKTTGIDPGTKSEPRREDVEKIKSAQILAKAQEREQRKEDEEEAGIHLAADEDEERRS